MRELFSTPESIMLFSPMADSRKISGSPVRSTVAPKTSAPAKQATPPAPEVKKSWSPGASASTASWGPKSASYTGGPANPKYAGGPANPQYTGGPASAGYAGGPKTPRY
jgi:hypothetical protein